MSSVPSATSNIPLWGQAWKLVVKYATKTGAETLTLGSESWVPDSLRVTFEVVQSMNSSPIWYADISIYNMDAAIIQNLLVNATWATLYAGFQSKPSPNYMGRIWDGPVFQRIYTRENVVDQKITLHCVALLTPDDSNLVNFSMGGPLNTQEKLMQLMVANNNVQIKAGSVATQRMAATQYPRGNTCFGSVSKFLAQLADSNFVQTWNDGKQAYISEVASGALTPKYVYSPAFPPGGVGSANDLPAGTSQSIIGTPQQIQQGIVFTVLLDPRLSVSLPPLVVQLVRTDITFLLRTPSVNDELPTIANSNLIFYVTQVRHSGDTRGNEWSTEVTGFGTDYGQVLLNLYTR